MSAYQVIALRMALGVTILEGLSFSRTISTTRRPECVAMRWWFASAACNPSSRLAFTASSVFATGLLPELPGLTGMEEAPGSASPMVSVQAVIVEAVPAVMQCPARAAIRAGVSEGGHGREVWADSQSRERTGGSCDALLDIAQASLVDGPGAVLIDRRPLVGAGAEHVAARVAPIHRTTT